MLSALLRTYRDRAVVVASAIVSTRFSSISIIVCSAGIAASQVHADQSVLSPHTTQQLRISTARSAYDLGLIQALASEFRRLNPHIEISIQSGGVLNAFSDGRNGRADVLLTHHKPEEERFLREGFASHQAQLMYSEYALFGPPNDPLKLHKEKNIITVFTRLAEEEAEFHAPSPQSGTNMKIEELWTIAGRGHEWLGYENTGASGVATLLQAAEFGVYTVAEMATYLANKEKLEGRILPLFRDDLNLRNRYTLSVVNANVVSGVNHSTAVEFFRYLVSAQGQDYIHRFSEQTFNANVFSPAAHLDPGLREEEAQNKFLNRTFDFQIAVAVSIVLSLLLVTTVTLFIRMRTVKRRHVESLANNAALKIARDDVARINSKLQLEIDERKKTEFQLHEAIKLLNLSERELRSYRDHLESLVRARTQDLEAAVRELQAFSYSVSHDLRSPLRAINGFSHMLTEDCADALKDNGKRYLQRIIDAANRMDTLIDDLLLLSRISQKDLACSRINMTQLARKVVKTIEHESRPTNARVVIDDHLFAFGDEHLLRILLDNLIGNAFKYSSTQLEPTIHFGKHECNEAQNSFFIHDNGVGFDMQYANKLFVPFQRLHQETEFPGNGIGLSTVQRVINRHNGKIWVESAINGGTTFYFSLPNRKQDIKPAKPTRADVVAHHDVAE